MAAVTSFVKLVRLQRETKLRPQNPSRRGTDHDRDKEAKRRVGAKDGATATVLY